MDSDFWAKVRKARDGQMSDEPKPLTEEERPSRTFAVLLREAASEAYKAGGMATSAMGEITRAENLKVPVDAEIVEHRLSLAALHLGRALSAVTAAQKHRDGKA